MRLLGGASLIQIPTSPWQTLKMQQAHFGRRKFRLCIHFLLSILNLDSGERSKADGEKELVLMTFINGEREEEGVKGGICSRENRRKESPKFCLLCPLQLHPLLGRSFLDQYLPTPSSPSYGNSLTPPTNNFHFLSSNYTFTLQKLNKSTITDPIP